MDMFSIMGIHSRTQTSNFDFLPFFQMACFGPVHDWHFYCILTASHADARLHFYPHDDKTYNLISKSHSLSFFAQQFEVTRQICATYRKSWTIEIVRSRHANCWASSIRLVLLNLATKFRKLRFIYGLTA